MNIVEYESNLNVIFNEIELDNERKRKEEEEEEQRRLNEAEAEQTPKKRGRRPGTKVTKKKTKVVVNEELVTLIGNMSGYYNSFNSPIINAVPSVVIRGLVRSEITEADFNDIEKMEEKIAYLQHFTKYAILF